MFTSPYELHISNMIGVHFKNVFLNPGTFYYSEN